MIGETYALSIIVPFALFALIMLLVAIVPKNKCK
jgi:hypothetical protein